MASFPGSNGKIAFNSTRSGNQEIYAMNADGSGVSNLSNNTAIDTQPAWSPDGLKLAFSSTRDGNFEIYVMNADGSGLTRLTNHPAIDDDPAWSADGTKIAFTSGRVGVTEVFVMNADGSGVTNLSNNAAFDSEPAWSPDGLRIVFTSTRDGNPEVYVMNSDGSGQINLTGNTAADREPNWSPDGSKIAFSTFRDLNSEVYVMNADGSGPTNLTNHITANDIEPAWSPDGLKIAFTTNRLGANEVFVMNADGSGPANLTINANSDFEPDWQVKPAILTVGKSVFGSPPINDWEFDGDLGTFTRQASGSEDTFFELAPGDYSITETNELPGWTASVSCDGGESGGSSVTVNLSSGEWEICSFSNTLCAPGTYDNGDPFCTEADPGHYVDTYGAITQTPCALGTFQPVSGGATCELANPGHYVDTTGSIEEIECSVGSYQPDYGADGCILAPPGYYVPDPAAIAAEPCLPGFYQTASGQLSCLPAPPGSYVPGSAATGVLACELGNYQDSPGQTSCISSPPGSFVDTTGAILYTLCAAGSYQPGSGMTGCFTSPPGSYVPSAGAIEPILCSMGSYQPGSGATSCLLADANHYVDTTGATTQVACPAGTSSTPGSDSLSDCMAPSAILVSAATAGTTGDGVAFGGEDVLEWDGDAWSIWFDGSAVGLSPTKNVNNIDALWIPNLNGQEVIFSFAANKRTLPGITGQVNGVDIVRWNGENFSLYFDGEDVGLTTLSAENVDALHILPGSESPIHTGECVDFLLISTLNKGSVPADVGGTISFSGEDVLGFCLVTGGGTTSGYWTMVLDGSTQGMPKNSTDSISMSADGETLYLTTKSTFIVDTASGGHSMVYAYNMTSQEFSGPYFGAAANGLPKTVDGLQVEGALP